MLLKSIVSNIRTQESGWVFGYVFKIIKSSLDGANELPTLKSWSAMFIDGFKVSLVICVCTACNIILLIM